MSVGIGDLTKWFELAQKQWHRPGAMFAALVVLTCVLAVVMGPLGLSPMVCGFLYLMGISGTIFWWWWSNRLPRTPKGKVGFVISIHAGEESERTKIKEDFVLTLQELLTSGGSDQSFKVIIVPNHVAEGIVDQDDAQALRVGCRAQFVIYGRVRLRTIAGSDQHVLHLEGLVTHKPVHQVASKNFSDEFRELFPRRLAIATENDVFSFAFTSDWVNCVARYIIGIAAAYSGALDHAEQLQNDVWRLLAGKDQAFPVFAKLKQRVPVRLAEIRYVRARKNYERWRNTRDPSDMATMGRHLDSIPSAHANQYNVLLVKSICLFVRDRDIKGAMAVLKKCKGQPDGTWLYNLAFLHAYIGDLRGAIRRYRGATKLRVGERTIADVEEFMCWLLEEEPEKYQIYYCLGFMNWKAKGDSTQAVRDFEAFLSAGNEHEFTKERELTQEWIAEIRNANKDLDHQ